LGGRTRQGDRRPIKIYASIKKETINVAGTTLKRKFLHEGLQKGSTGGKLREGGLELNIKGFSEKKRV